MSAATILFTDIVSFSKKPTSEQKKLVEALTAEVIYDLRPLLNPPIDVPTVIALPTGDGLALAFMHRLDHLWNRSTILNLILRLQIWADRNSTQDNRISLRIGVHVGAVEIISDINNKPNVCGDTINFAQRVMDAANPRQVLFSETAFSEYVGSESPKCFVNSSSLPNFEVSFVGPIEVYAKHKRQILVYKLTIEPEQEFWFNGDPVAKHLMLVGLTPLPKEMVGSFADNIRQAQDIAFIQVTGERFLQKFNAQEITFSKNLKRFWVLMPHPDAYKNQNLTAHKASSEFIIECINKWKSLFDKVGQDFPEADLKFGLFREPPFFGASFIDWERPDGKIHVSPYVWSVPVTKCPGYDMEWVGKKPSPVYETYVQGLRYLKDISENIFGEKNK